MNEHQGHRQRMKAKFDKFGPSVFEDHELLEILLYFAIPRVDTNLLAHKLLERFDGLTGVLNADESELTKIEGIGPQSAWLIKTAAAMAGRYIQRENKADNAFDDIAKLGEYLVGLFAGESCEKLYLLALDKKGRIIEEIHIASGVMDRLEFSSRRIADIAIRVNSSHVILAHNHPSGYARPSKNDTDMTYRVQYALSQVGVKLIEHFIVSGSEYYTILRNNDILR